ncbi:MAG: rod shape-determining protein MreC [Brevinematales bacterium]|nr:rod shape-determining protein MreC [Brevinematales bacterium]
MQFLYFYKNKKTFTLIILLVISFGLMFFNVKISFLQIRNVLFFVVYPFETAISWIGNSVVKTFSSFKEIEELEKELSLTKERLTKYQEFLTMYEQLLKENEELRKALEVKNSFSFKSIYAKVVFRDPSFLNQTLIINKGSVHGVKVNMSVVSYDEAGNSYLVGKTVEVSPFSSKVKVLNASDFYLGVVFEKNRYIGIMQGSGSFNNCVVNYVPVEAPIEIGEGVLTSGESDIFPPNIRVGKVIASSSSMTDKFFRRVYVKPVLIYSKIKDVFVVLWQNEEEILEKKVEYKE